MFQKLSLNFTWWVNRKDAQGRNIFEGGFLGSRQYLGPSIGPMGPPRRDPLPDRWDGLDGDVCPQLLQIALELAIEDPVYEDMATKFFEHFLSHRRCDEQH